MNYLIKNGKVYYKGTLAQYLDRRAVPVEEPSATDLPATINPFRFLREHLLSNNCVIIKLKHSEMRYSTELLFLVNDLTPAEQAVLIYVDVDDLRTPVQPTILTNVNFCPAVQVASQAPTAIGATVTVSTLNEVCK